MAAERHGEWRLTSDVRKSNARWRVATVSREQHGRVRYDQLRELGIGEATICRWVETGYLHPVLPRVYAVGHRAQTIEAGLSEALLYAGPGAMLSHGTAIWWLGLLNFPPPQVHVSTPRRIKSLDRVIIHGRRNLKRTVHNGLPTTTVSQALIDFAPEARSDLLRLALANADYQGVLDPGDLQRGRALKRALALHLPELSHTRSDAERLLLTLCQDHGFPIPKCNHLLEGWLVDAFWAEAKVVVEIDGWRGHRSRAQLERDHQRDLELRRAGYTVLRYTWRRLRDTPEAIAAELRRYL